MVLRDLQPRLNDLELWQQILYYTDRLNSTEKMLEIRRLININYGIGYMDPENERKRKLRYMGISTTLDDRVTDPNLFSLSQQYWDNFKSSHEQYMEVYRQAIDFLKYLQNIYAIVSLNMNNGKFVIFKGKEELDQFYALFGDQFKMTPHVLDQTNDFIFFFCNREIDVLFAQLIIKLIGNPSVLPIDKSPSTIDTRPYSIAVSSGKHDIIRSEPYTESRALKRKIDEEEQTQLQVEGSIVPRGKEPEYELKSPKTPTEIRSEFELFSSPTTIGLEQRKKELERPEKLLSPTGIPGTVFKRYSMLRDFFSKKDIEEFEEKSKLSSLIRSLDDLEKNLASPLKKVQESNIDKIEKLEYEQTRIVNRTKRREQIKKASSVTREEFIKMQKRRAQRQKESILAKKLKTIREPK